MCVRVCVCVCVFVCVCVCVSDVAQYRANYIQLLVPVTCNMGNKGNQYETTMATYLCRKIIIQRVR